MRWLPKNVQIFSRFQVWKPLEGHQPQALLKSIYIAWFLIRKEEILGEEHRGKNLWATVEVEEKLRWWLDKVSLLLINFIWKPHQGRGKGICEQTTNVPREKELACSTHSSPLHTQSSKLELYQKYKDFLHTTLPSLSVQLWGTYILPIIATEWKTRQSIKQEKKIAKAAFHCGFPILNQVWVIRG